MIFKGRNKCYFIKDNEIIYNYCKRYNQQNCCDTEKRNQTTKIITEIKKN